ncbi:MAG: Gingipain R1 precursor [Chloroflexi bacterium ADurb.Bin325]|nr:MAG: Gingipain R1 precursor [Chloroflexi bacterium ADurb.Bin325]
MTPDAPRRYRVALLLALLALAALAGCGRTPPTGTTTVKLLVDVDGVYQVSARELAAAGFDLGAGSDGLALTAGGEPVAFELTGQGRDRALRFYGQGLGPEAYTATNVYWLTRGPAAGDTPNHIAAAEGTPPAAGAATQVVTATMRIEEQRQRRSDGRETEDRWTWRTLFAPTEFEFKADVPAPADGSGMLSLYVIANSQAPVAPDHHLTVTVNDAPVADVTWDGLGPHIITATIPAGILRAGENIVRLAAPGDTGAAADAVILDRAELAYARTLILEGETLTFAGDAAAYAVELAERPVLFWDITDPARPVALPLTGAQDGRLTVRGGDGLRRFIAATERGLRKPTAILPAPASDLPDFPGGADLLIVTTPQFRAALQPLVVARTEQGLRVAVVDVAAVNDAFNHGRAGPDGIRNLVQHALAAWEPPAPRFLLLAGDASYDPRGYLSATETDHVPTQEVYTAYSGWSASDVWYGMPDDGPAAKPQIAIGRLPAQTPEQMAVMVRKTLAYAQAGDAAWRRNALLVADNDEPGFATAAADFATQLAGYDTQQVTIADDGRAAREQLISAFDGGTGLIGYFGHGSVVLWAQEKVFATDDVAQLTNRNRLSIVFTVTCLSGFFDHPTTPSLGETLLRADNGGAVAALVPSSAAVLSDQRLLAQNLADALAGDVETLGAAVLRAQAGLPETLDGVRDILLTFNLLGDPTLPLGR